MSRFKVLIYLTIALFIIMIIDSASTTFNVPEGYLTIFTGIFTIGYPAYFAARSYDRKIATHPADVRNDNRRHNV